MYLPRCIQNNYLKEQYLYPTILQKSLFYKDRAYLPQGNTTKEQKQRLRLKQYNNEENIFILYISCILYIIFNIFLCILNKIKLPLYKTCLTINK